MNVTPRVMTVTLRVMTSTLRVMTITLRVMTVTLRVMTITLRVMTITHKSARHVRFPSADLAETGLFRVKGQKTAHLVAPIFERRAFSAGKRGLEHP